MENKEEIINDENVVSKNINENKDIYSLNHINTSENNLRIRDGFAFIGFYLISNLASIMLLDVFVDITPKNSMKMIGYANLLGSLFTFIFLLVYINRKNIKIFNRAKILKPKWVDFVLIPIYTLLTIMLPSLILSLSGNTNQSGEVTTNNQEVLQTISDKTNPIVIFFMIVVFAPIIEEILFRAIPIFYKSKKFKWLNSNIAIVLRVIIASLIFGSMHNPNNLIELIAYSSSGFVLGSSVLLTNRIETSIGIHFVNNFIGFLSLISLL